MTSDGTFPRRLTKVDDLIRPDHRHLTAADVCYFIGEYTAYRGYAHSDTNRLIFNFKKTMDRRGRPEWRYKDQAIQTAAAAFRRTLAPKDLDRLTFVPIPPSKAKGDPLYDDRLTRMLGAIRPKPPLDVRELIVQMVGTDAVHARDVRPAPEQIQALYRIDETLTEPAPGIIAVVDDILATGAHFRAAASVLSARFPAAAIVGLFIARRAPDTADLEDFDDGDFFSDADVWRPQGSSLCVLYGQAFGEHVA